MGRKGRYVHRRVNVSVRQADVHTVRVRCKTFRRNGGAPEATEYYKRIVQQRILEIIREILQCIARNFFAPPSHRGVVHQFRVVVRNKTLLSALPAGVVRIELMCPDRVHEVHCQI